MNELALFAGAGGGILGGKLLGWRTVCAVERDAFAAQILAQRQNDGCLEPFPIWSDVCSFDGRPWRGIVDVISGGFPCQDISSAGKGAGIEGARSGLWSEFARIIGEVRPRFVLVENSPMLTSRGLGRVLGDLASLGFDAEWGVLGAHHAGAPHKRDRIWILGYSSSNGEPVSTLNDETPGVQGHASNPQRLGPYRPQDKRILESEGADQFRPIEPGNPGDLDDPQRWRLQGRHEQQPESAAIQPSQDCRDSGGSLYGQAWWPEPDFPRVAYGVADQLDRLKAIGNGQVPRVAAMAWQILHRRLTEN